MQANTPKFHAWLVAERDAQSAEREVYALIIQFARCSAIPPEDKLACAREKRARARELFQDAMQEMKELAHSLHHRRIQTTGVSRPDIAAPFAGNAGAFSGTAPSAD